MNRERYEKIKAVFLAVRGAPPAERASRLEAACGTDPRLREEVESLLARDAAAGGRDEHGSPNDPSGESGASASPPRLVPGMIGSYRILGVIGEGGMGIVYRAEQRKPRRAVALKVIKSGLASPERLVRFEREAEVLGRLHHPGIAQIYEASTADTGSGPQPFFVMELIDGAPLTRYVERHEMSARDRLELFLKVCDAVAHAHEKGVVHRDLKPANILVDEYGAPKVLDFGVARTTDRQTTHALRTEAGQIIGTIPYMSPEQLAAAPGDVDGLADVYALGVICYEMLSGRLPFEVEGHALPELIRIISEEDPVPLGSSDGALRGELETIVARALEKDRIHRYASVAAFAAAVRRYLERDAAGAHPDRPADRDGSFVTNIAFSRNPFFTGRDVALADLRAALTAGADTGAPRRQAISGLGGIGKTQTAVEYAYRSASDYEAVLWVRAESREEIVSSLDEIARTLDLPSKDDKEASVIVAAVRTWLQNHSGWLLVLDNAEDPDILEELLPASGSGHVLLTSRAQVFRDLGVSRPLVLGPLEPEESCEFLFRSTDADPRDEREVEAAVELAFELGHLPLALEQAARLIAVNHALVQDYLEAYRAQRPSLLAEGRPRDYDHSVATTWDMSFAAVESISGATADVLRLSAFLSPDAIPLELITRGAAVCGPRLSVAFEGAADDPLLVHRTLEPLTRFSLIHVDPGSRSFTVHRLVQALLADRMDARIRALWKDRAVRAVNAAFPGFYPENRQLDEWALCGRLLPHARAVTDDFEDLDVDLEQVGDVLDKTSVYMMQAGQFATAEQITRRCLGLRLRMHGPMDRRVGRCVHGLALAAHQQMQYGSAERLYERAIGIWERACGKEHHQVALGLQNLGLLCRNQCRPTEAERLHRRALDIRMRELGPDSAHVAVSLNSLALLRWEDGGFDEAETLLRRSLTIRSRCFGPEHHEVASAYHNLGAVLREQGQWKEAESFLRQSIVIRERTFGPVHHLIAASLATLARLYHLQKRVAEAEELYRRAIEIFGATIGLEHYYCAKTFELFSELLRELNQPVEGSKLAEQAAAIRLKEAGRVETPVSL